MIPLYILAIEDSDDREFMSKLFVQYQRLMYSTIFEILHDTWATEDVLQTTVEKLIDKLSLLKKFDHAHLASYIITACRHTAYNDLRYKSRHKICSLDVEDGFELNSIDVEPQIIRIMDLEALSNVWQDLDPRSRYVLEARYLLEKSTDEIASELNIKPDSVRMAISRARKKAYMLMTK